MTVSVVVPTYNRAATLARALASIAAQTRPPNQIVVVDDGSTDSTAAVIAAFAGVELVRLPRNRGAAAARNEGLRRARGEYVAFLDSDDEWLPGKLGDQLAHLQARPLLTLCGTGIRVHRVDGTVEQHAFEATVPEGGWNFSHFLRYPFSTSTWLCRRARLLDAGAFDDALPNCEDLDLLARLAGSGSIEMLPAVLTVKHNQREALDTDRERRARSFAVLFERHAALWVRTPEAAARSSHRLAAMHFRAGDMARGRAALRDALRRRPLHLKYWALLALSLLGHGFYVRGLPRLRALLGVK